MTPSLPMMIILVQHSQSEFSNSDCCKTRILKQCVRVCKSVVFVLCSSSLSFPRLWLPQKYKLWYHLSWICYKFSWNASYDFFWNPWKTFKIQNLKQETDPYSRKSDRINQERKQKQSGEFWLYHVLCLNLNEYCIIFIPFFWSLHDIIRPMSFNKFRDKW